MSAAGTVGSSGATLLQYMGEPDVDQQTQVRTTYMTERKDQQTQVCTTYMTELTKITDRHLLFECQDNSFWCD